MIRNQGVQILVESFLLLLFFFLFTFIYNCYLLGQLQHNRGSLPVVDVVVDPHLSSHLRPHQREGVRFLYECAMGLRDFSGNGAILAYVVTIINHLNS